MWSLILVLAFARGYDVAAIATPVIPGFSSRETCAEAGNSVPDIRRFICVKVQ